MFQYRFVRTSTWTTCFNLERIDWQTPILVCQRRHGIRIFRSRGPRRGITRLFKTSEVGIPHSRGPRWVFHRLSAQLISPPLGQDRLKAGRVRSSRVFLARWSVYCLRCRWGAVPPSALVVLSRVRSVLTSRTSTGKLRF